MKKLNKYLIWLPETLMAALTIYFWTTSGKFFNPIPIVLLLILSSQFYFKSRTIGIFCSLTFVLASLYLCLALLSDVVKIENWDSKSYEFLTWGLVFILSMLIISFWMMISKFNYQKQIKVD